jgi:hypothetical protein
LALGLHPVQVGRRDAAEIGGLDGHR